MQENLLFNRSVHDNIAFANPAMPRAHVKKIARLTGADAFKWGRFLDAGSPQLNFLDFRA